MLIQRGMQKGRLINFALFEKFYPLKVTPDENDDLVQNSAVNFFI